MLCQYYTTVLRRQRDTVGAPLVLKLSSEQISSDLGTVCLCSFPIHKMFTYYNIIQSLLNRIMYITCRQGRHGYNNELEYYDYRPGSSRLDYIILIKSTELIHHFTEYNNYIVL